MSLATDLLALLGDGRADTDLNVLQYTVSFERLWSDTWNVARRPGQPTPRIIVWDGVPAGHRLLLPHLTPLDWALAVSIHTVAHSQACANWSLHIVDLSLGTHHDCWAQRHAAALLDAMPWVRLYGPLHLKRRAYDARRLLPVLSRQFEDTPSLAACLADGHDARLETLRSLAQSWQGSLQRSDEHHDLNNLVAPVLLSGEYSRQVRDPSLHAFRTKCRWIGAIPEQLPALDGTTDAVAEALAAIPIGDTPKVVLVDDMAALGWGALVKSWMGPGANINFSCESSPERFLQVLRQCTSEDFRYRSYSRSVCQTDATAPVDEVIIWDLRLFGRAVTGELGHDWRAAERSFYQTLLKVIDACELHDAGDLAWPSFAASELAALRSWLGGCTAELPDVALTFAPRCLALLSPTTPIIVLSTTTRRAVIELLRPYRNVFTDVEKPRPVDHFARDLLHFAEQWATVWRQAAALISTRRQLRIIEKAGSWLTELREPTISLSASSEGDVPYVEIYVDESGDEGQRVGGIVAVYPKSRGTQNDANEFDDVLFANGICYYDPLVKRVQTRIPIKAKDTLCSKELAAALAAFNAVTRRVQLYPFELEFDVSSERNTDSSLRGVGDFKYFQTLSTAIELLLYDVLAQVLGTRFAVSLYVATRQFSNRLPHWHEAVRDFGYENIIFTADNHQLAESMSGPSVLPMLARLTAERRTAERFGVHRALAVRLVYENSSKPMMLPNRFLCRREDCGASAIFDKRDVAGQLRGIPGTVLNMPQATTGNRSIAHNLPSPSAGSGCASGHKWVPDHRALHYVADEILRGQRGYADCLTPGLPGFTDRDDSQLRALILASRLADQGEPVLALIRLVTALEGPRPSALTVSTPMRQLLVAKLLPAARTLSGADFFKVAAAVSSSDGKERTSRCRIHFALESDTPDWRRQQPQSFSSLLESRGLRNVTIVGWTGDGQLIVDFLDDNLEFEEWSALATALRLGRVTLRIQTPMMQSMLRRWL